MTSCFRKPGFAVLMLAMAMAGRAAEPPPDFNRDIRPLLSDRCFTCHGFDAKARKEDLRLDTPEGAYAPRKGGTAAIVPGNPAKSLAWQHIISTDPDEVMPPADSHLTLSDPEKQLIRRWIEHGAVYQPHWTLVRVEKPPVPAGADHPIDGFVTRRLAQDGLSLAPAAPNAALIRRLSIDLRGLPPSPEETAAFLADTTPDAYAKLVDRFLEDPAYGERMAWPWLDAARYADSNGYQGDADRTQWPWRDWVSGAFNRNLSYDQFTIWQLAGDLLPDATAEQILATGFLRNHPINGEGGSIPEENRVNYAMDMTETTGTVWMALTFNCCRCHDHKYDALTQRDYYSLLAFFDQTPVDGSGGNPHTPPVLEVRSASQAPGTKNIPKVMVMADRKQRRKTHVLAIGSYDKPLEEVTASTPSILPPLATTDGSSPPNRLDLAKWLVAREHPLTARVTVNHFWQEIFGIGLIKTPEDFGVQSEVPAHPELLDWLAADFMECGWDVKRLMRTIVTSRTYRQSSRVSQELLDKDPANRLLARGPRFRLPAWMIRDQALAASGLLARRGGGAPVKPYQPENLWPDATFGKVKYVRDRGEALYRRSLYTFWRRISMPPMFFDNAKREVCTVNPSRTNTPLHALATLNDTTFVEAARVLASRAVKDAGKEPAAALTRAFSIVLSRPPTAGETTVLLASHHQARTNFAADPAAAKALLANGDSPADAALDPVEHAALACVCLSILNTDEALTKE
jgi:hypothetical protein